MGSNQTKSGEISVPDPLHKSITTMHLIMRSLLQFNPAKQFEFIIALCILDDVLLKC